MYVKNFPINIHITLYEVFEDLFSNVQLSES